MGIVGLRKERMFFFEKKNQKTFVCLVTRYLMKYASGDEGAGVKVFCFFFSKKKAFLPFSMQPCHLS
jgi:hypothetical protein